MRKHREHLEELVEERTAELSAINERLQREIAERKKTGETLRHAAQEWLTTFPLLSYQEAESRERRAERKKNKESD